MANVIGRGLKPANKKGERRGGRQPGSMNSLGRDLKEALLDAAQEVGEVEETEIFDKDGKPTGQFSRKATGKGGLKGYLKWAAVHRANAFIAQLGPRDADPDQREGRSAEACRVSKPRRIPRRAARQGD